jgi:hypothetical protein
MGVSESWSCRERGTSRALRDVCQGELVLRRAPASAGVISSTRKRHCEYDFDIDRVDEFRA